MSIFQSILDKLGIHPAAAPAPAKPAAPATMAPSVPPAGGPPPMMAPATPPAGPPAAMARPASIPMVDVVSKLDGMAKGHPGCDWKVSIADLLQLLGLDNSLNARKALATELGCPADLMTGDFAQMNMWLHKTVLAKIAENGGNIPPELLHH